MPNVFDPSFLNITNAAIRNANKFGILSVLEPTAIDSNPVDPLLGTISLDQLFENTQGPVRTVRASGNPTTDDELMTAAVALINNNAKGGTILVDGMVTLSQVHTLYNATPNWTVSVLGLGSHSGFRYKANGGGSNIIIGNDTDYVDLAGTLLPSTIAFRDTAFDATGLGITDGAFGILVSDGDAIDVYPFNGVGEQHPTQLISVNHLEGNTARIHSAIWDNYTDASKKWVPITPIHGVRISNLWLENDNTPAGPNSNVFKLVGCNGFEISNLRKRHPSGGGEVTLEYSMNGIIHGCRFDGVDVSDTEYHFQINTCNGLLFCGNIINTARHFFTTSGAKASGDDRWGTPCDIAIVGNIFRWSEMQDFSGQSAIDTHPEGYGITVAGNIFYLGHKAIGITNEARAMDIFGNTFWGGDNSKGCRIAKGYDTKIWGNRFMQTGIGIDTDADAKRTRIKRNYFWGGVTQIRNLADDTEIEDNEFDEWLTNSIELAAGQTGTKIRRNIMDKSSGDVDNIKVEGLTSADVELEDNYVRGYANGAMGLENDTGGLELAYHNSNKTTPTNLAHTGDGTIAATPVYTKHTNTGAGGKVILTLDDAYPVNGPIVTVEVTAAQELEITTGVGGSGDVIRCVDENRTRIISAVVGDSISLEKISATVWRIVEQSGAWFARRILAAADDATPDGTAATIIDTSANTVLTVITAIDGEVPDKSYLTIECDNANTEIQDGGNFSLVADATFTSGANGGYISFQKRSAVLVETGRAIP
jgi:hypothetical protein